MARDRTLGYAMDETDLFLLDALIQDSRTPYSVLARRLKMSVPAVHKRVATLQDSGVITKFTANLSVGFLRAVRVYLSGISETYPLRQAVDNLRKDDRPDIVVTGSANLVGVRALLPTIQDLEPFVAFFRKAAAVASPWIGIEAVAIYGSNPPHRTSPRAAEPGLVDYRILYALHDDARKSIADVCEQLHLSPKTVRNRLRRLAEDGVVEFSLEVQPGSQAGVSAYLAVFLRPDVDVEAFRERLVSDLKPRILWSLIASNLPSGFTAQSWSPTTVAHEELVNRVNAYDGVEKIVVNLISHYDFCETWRDQLLKQRAEAAPS